MTTQMTDAIRAVINKVNAAIHDSMPAPVTIALIAVIAIYDAIIKSILWQSVRLETQKIMLQDFQNLLKHLTRNDYDNALICIQGLKSHIETLPGNIQGISASLNEHLIAANSRRERNWFWLVGSLFFVGGSIAIGIGHLFISGFPGYGSDLSYSIARIIIMSTLIGAAWFCATRYMRGENIIEDYAYKSDVADTLFTFLHFFDGEERKWFLRRIMEERLKDPLRKQRDMEHPAMSILQRITRSKKDDEGDQ